MRQQAAWQPSSQVFGNAVNDQDRINHAATTCYLQARRLQVLLFICHQKTSFDTSRVFLASQLLRAPTDRVLLPSCAIHHQRTLSVCMRGHTCTCVLWVPQPSVCVHRHTCEQLGCHPSWHVCCPHPDLAQTCSLSQPRALALENQLLGRALAMDQLFVVVLRGWAGVVVQL